jgi:hypothetical protein
VTFNAFWIAVWVLCALGVRAGFRMAFFPVWFFAIAMIGNGVAHPRSPSRRAATSRGSSHHRSSAWLGCCSAARSFGSRTRGTRLHAQEPQ